MVVLGVLKAVAFFFTLLMTVLLCLSSPLKTEYGSKNFFIWAGICQFWEKNNYMSFLSVFCRKWRRWKQTTNAWRTRTELWSGWSANCPNSCQSNHPVLRTVNTQVQGLELTVLFPRCNVCYRWEDDESFSRPHGIPESCHVCTCVWQRMKSC